MSKTKLSILLATVAFVSLIAFGLWTRPKVQDIDSENFSAERVVKDIEVISQEHHSVAHPAERAKVRQYLLERLQELGADTIKIFEHKDLVGPENKHVVYTFDAYNILAEFAPLHADSADNQNTSLMMVAHYDSRYSQPMPRQDTVWSYGAADDGYGVGVILETLNQALKYRSEWKQSFKILFTDAEEPGMQGMKALWREHREVFDEVGLMINVEARGPFGPALLFETSPGSKNLVKLYQQTARYPHTYSLTTVVYGFMPNFTDFTIVKDEIPGLNFSTIADINHYHTNLDNFSNIQPRSIQHYGAQIVPLVHEYLTNARYCDKDILRSDENSINFSIPLLGLLNFSKTTYTWVNILVFVCFLLILLLDIIRGRAKFAQIWLAALKTLLMAIGVLLVGELIAYLSCLASGAIFKPFGIVQGVKADNIIMIIATVLMFCLMCFCYWRKRKAIQKQSAHSLRKSASQNAARMYAGNQLHGVLLLLTVLSLALLLAINENLMFFIPLFAAILAMFLYRITNLRFWCLIAIALILLHSLSFLYALAMALTIGAFGAVLMIAYLQLKVLIPLADLFVLED